MFFAKCGQITERQSKATAASCGLSLISLVKVDSVSLHETSQINLCIKVLCSFQGIFFCLFVCENYFLNNLHKHTLCSCFMNKAWCFYAFSTCCRGLKIRMKMSLWRPVNFGSHLPSSLCVRRFCVDTCLSEHVQTHSVLLIKRKNHQLL